jgi:uncharacterized membrane protein
MAVQQSTEIFEAHRQANRAKPQELKRRGENKAEQRRLTEFEPNKLARSLGWLSIGLGIVETAAPQAMANVMGLSRNHRLLLRIFGLREIACGIGILTHRPPFWMRLRVGGDAVDLAFLALAFTADNPNRARLGAVTAAVAAVTALDVLCSQELNLRTAGDHDIHVEKSVMINRSREELYKFWRDFEQLPRFMNHLENVRVTGDTRSHWVAKAPAGRTVEWDAEITEDRPSELIAWRSLRNADVENRGSVRFEPATGGRGTVVRVTLDYNPPAGGLGAVIAKLFGEEPAQQVQEDLRRLKQLLEAGETPTTKGQPSARR